MSNYLLDTNHVSPLLTPGHPLRLRVLQQMEQGDSFGICIPVITETLFGVGIVPRAAANRVEWERMRALFTYYVPDETDAVSAADLQITLRKRGRQLATIDALIATIALRHNLILLTTDRDFQAVPNLTIENWMLL